MGLLLSGMGLLLSGMGLVLDVDGDTVQMPQGFPECRNFVLKSQPKPLWKKNRKKAVKRAQRNLSSE